MSTNGINYYAELGIINLISSKDFGEAINRHILELRRKEGIDCPDTFIIPIKQDRFSNGEGKIILQETARAKDIYIICDIGNHNCRYKLYGHDNRMGPDEHFQDVKRAIFAIGGKAARVSVVMPLLYASRQDRNKGRESLDCAVALQELERMGVKDVITFDVHNPTVQNAIPLLSFENLYATEAIIRAICEDEGEMIKAPDNILIISPDSGGMERAIYYSTILNINIGMFYKRRDFSRLVDGTHPIEQHDYLGQDVEGKDVIIIDDMIASGASIAECVHDLKERGANKVFVAATFSMFTKGPDIFQELYEENKLTRLYSTNLTYATDEVISSDWFRRVDLAPFTASVINTLNTNKSIAPLINRTDRLREMISNHRLTPKHNPSLPTDSQWI